MSAPDLEREWAVAEYDSAGNIVHVSHHDYQPETVMLALRAEQERLSANGIRIEGTLRLVSRQFTGWLSENG